MNLNRTRKVSKYLSHNSPPVELSGCCSRSCAILELKKFMSSSRVLSHMLGSSFSMESPRPDELFQYSMENSVGSLKSPLFWSLNSPLFWSLNSPLFGILSSPLVRQGILSSPLFAHGVPSLLLLVSNSLLMCVPSAR